MLVGDVTVYRGGRMDKGWSGDQNMPESYAKKLSADPRLNGADVQWTCRNGARETVHYTDGLEVKAEKGGAL